MADVLQAVALPYVRLIAEQLERMDVSLDHWLELSGLVRADLEDPSFVLDLVAFRSLARDARRLSREPAFGLRVGERLGIRAHGALGYAALNCRTLREVLDLVVRFLGLRIAVAALSVATTPRGVRLQVQPTVPLGDVYTMVLEGVVSSLKKFLEDVSMGGCDIRSVVFSFPDLGYGSQARSLLGCPVHYDQDWSGLLLDARTLDLALKTSDPAALRQAEVMCERELRALQDSNTWATRVRRVLLDRRVGFASLAETARQLGVTQRTLHRRLVAEGTSFRAILEDTRKRLAVDQLTNGTASIEEISYILGYSDPANFRRAVRRWTGVPPSRLRG